MTVDPNAAAAQPVLYLVLIAIVALFTGFGALLRWIILQEREQQNNWMKFLAEYNRARDDQNDKRDKILSELVKEIASMQGAVNGMSTALSNQQNLVNRMVDYVRTKQTGELKSP